MKESRPFEIGFQEQVSNHLQVSRVKSARVASIGGKVIQNMAGA